ncbi:hypothetical protein ACFC7A_26200 [Streptomyces niveus]|uniref:hypothetical protein n=1 Tax=Streptomyces niveus TaxID=193462 RepID=UPI0035E15219
MSIELIISPRGENVRAQLADAPAWSAYVTELRRVLLMAIEKSDVAFLEVGELLVSEPLPARFSHLRNGLEVRPVDAVDLVEEMVAGRGPYCRLLMPGRLHVEPGWDGAVHIYVRPSVAVDLGELGGGEAGFRWRDATPEPVDVSKLVDAVADEGFWSALRETAEGVTLLCERWAHGVYGCRWFRVAPGNVTELARLVRPRSLLRSISAPDLRPKPEILEEDFTAFAAPLVPGELRYKAYPGGADSLSEVVTAGFPFVLADEVSGNRYAVVPDLDGVVRGQWEKPGES